MKPQPRSKTRPSALGIILSLASILLAGCSSAPPGQQNASPAPIAQPALASPSTYDYYILNLSWSPEFCFSHSSSPECAAHPGFVVHGLWPERNDGSYPQNCPSRPGPTSDAAWQGVIPTRELAQHEWQTHGVCTPYDADTYFGLIRKAYQSVKIPEAFTNTNRQTMQPPTAIIDSFARINTGVPSGGIVLSCGRNYLTAIEVCFDKNLQPTACTGLRTCRANNVKITPQNSGN